MSAPSKPLRRWEYRRVSIENQSEHGHPPPMYEADVRELNEHGAEGWEFVSWVIDCNMTVHAMMKREVLS